AAVERLAFAVARDRGIHGILRQIFAKAALRDRGAIEVVYAVSSAARGVDPALEALAAGFLAFGQHQRIAVGRGAFECSLDIHGLGIEIERLADLESDALQPMDHRIIEKARWIVRQ